MRAPWSPSCSPLSEEKPLRACTERVRRWGERRPRETRRKRGAVPSFAGDPPAPASAGAVAHPQGLRDLELRCSDLSPEPFFFPGSGLLAGTCLSAEGAGVLLLIETAVLILQGVTGLLKNESPPHRLRLGQRTLPWDSAKRNAKPWSFPSDELKDITECKLCFFFFFKFYLFIYLFIYWLCWVFGSCEGFL